MKKLHVFYLLIISIFLVSCVKDTITNDIDAQSTYSKKIDQLESLSENELVNIPYKEGYVTIVTYGEDTLAVASRENETMFLQKGIVLPEGSYSTKLEQNTSNTRSIKSTNVTKADDIDEDAVDTYKVTYEDAKSFSGEENLSNNFYAVMFEDTKDADYDYNDLIIHTKYLFHYDPYPTEVLDVYVQGIALGSSKTIKLGFYTQTGKKYVSQNVREDLFSHENLYDQTQQVRPYFINTEKVYEDSLCHFKMGNKVRCSVTDKSTDYVVWFIEAINPQTNEIDTFIAPTSIKMADITDRANMFSSIGRSYGVVRRSTLTIYPCEKVSIDKPFPNFFKWIDGEIDGSFDSVALKKSDDSNVNQYYINSWKIWDYDKSDFN